MTIKERIKKTPKHQKVFAFAFVVFYVYQFIAFIPAGYAKYG